MTDFPRILARVAQYRLARAIFVAVVVAVTSVAGMSRAEAQTDPYASCQTTAQTGACATQTIAAQRATLLAENNKPTGNGYPYMCSKKTANSLRWEAYYTTLANCGGFAFTVYSRTWPAGTECPNGIDPATGYCLPDQAQCLARNTLAGFANPGITSRNYSAKCINGCNFAMNGGTVTTSPNGTGIVANGTFTWTGTCANPDPVETVTTAAQPKPQECIQIADAAGSACVKANGEHCHKASNGFQACWFPGETGEKVVGDVLQKKVAGTTEIPPSLNLPNGDTLVKQPPSVTTSTTNTTTNKTTTTTTTNYVTTNGTTPPGTKAGEPDDGSASSEGEGEGDEKSSVSGGGNCEEADKPVAVGDAILSNILEQAWRTRCAIDSGNAVESTGSIEDCSQPFTVSGPPKSANVLKLKGLREQICGNAVKTTGDIGNCAEPFTLTGPAESPEYQKMRALRTQTCGVAQTVNELYGTDDDSAAQAGVKDGLIQEFTAGVESLDVSGYGWARSCPQMPVVQAMGVTLDFNFPQLCDLGNLVGFLCITLTGFVCIRGFLGSA